jgi:uncharacterized protein YodC (DUF2158 family)
VTVGEENRFRVGQVVKLRSGGPNMTVELDSVAGSDVAVVWYDPTSCEHTSATFPAECLVEA